MRMMLKVQIPTPAGNDAIQDGRLDSTLQSLFAQIQPEAAYFTLNEGDRCAYVVFDMTDSAMLPVIAEPLFANLDAIVDFTPVMTQADLASGLSQAQG